MSYHCIPFSKSRFTVTLLYILFRENKSCFLYFLLIKAGLKQGCNKPLFYAVLRIPVDMPVFNGGDLGFACCNAVKPRLRLPAPRWSPGQSFHRVKD